jgi:hypothetical protein
MQVTNWGMFLLGVYLILNGLSALGINLGFNIISLVALIAGILILVDNSYSRR